MSCTGWVIFLPRTMILILNLHRMVTRQNVRTLCFLHWYHWMHCKQEWHIHRKHLVFCEAMFSWSVKMCWKAFRLVFLSTDVMYCYQQKDLLYVNIKNVLNIAPGLQIYSESRGNQRRWKCGWQTKRKDREDLKEGLWIIRLCRITYGHGCY